MKKIFALLLTLVMVLSLCACGESKPVELKGAFQADKTIALVFDYSDFENQLPEKKEDITLTVNEKVYYAASNPSSTSLNTGASTKLYDAYDRYYGYGYALGYGTVEQGAPKRMLVIFNDVEATDLTNVQFKLGEIVLDLKASDFVAIDSVEEIIKAEKNFDKAYQIASFKWRIDSAYTMSEGLNIYEKIPFGASFNYLSKQIALIFDNTVEWGIKVTASPKTNFSNKDELNDKVVSDTLPAFDAEIVKKAYPAAAEQIDAIIANTNALATEITNKDKSMEHADVVAVREAIKTAYTELCEILGMEAVVVAK